jgi:solute carrier family 13 (sodium-dependent dicarboxylate transporter), member 2/3/5
MATAEAHRADPASSWAGVGRWLGPGLFVLVLVAPTGALQGDAKRVAAATLWMAVWWVTEAVPLAATSMLPLVLFPLLEVRRVSMVAPNYADHIIFLFLGGFVLALAVERSGLHRRLALAVLTGVGASPRRLVWGFLIATAVLSMWLSNTATALMMLPIAGGVAAKVGHEGVPTRLFLAVAYGASVGGIGTLVGTPPNLVLAGMAPSLVPDLPPLTFGQWMLFGVPLVLVFMPVVGLLLGRGLPRRVAADPGLREERARLGPMGVRERRVAVLFALTALAWVTRSDLSFGVMRVPGWSSLLSDPKLVSDAVPAIAAALLATLLPTGEGAGTRLLSWEEIRHGVPWGVLLLFGGGFALADAVHASGLEGWLAGSLHGLAVLPLPLIILAICLITTFATELTSNTATATLLMPVMAALSGVLAVPPYLLMVPATVSASCAFMLPVATPPNAIVIGSGHVSTQDLFRTGIWLNLAGAVVITVLVLTLGQMVLPVS